MRVWVDPDRCRGHALCLTHAPDAFEFIDLEDRSVVIEGAVDTVPLEVFQSCCPRMPRAGNHHRSRDEHWALTAKHVIDFDHHSPKLRDHNTELLKSLMYNEGGCPMGWSSAHGGFWAIWGYDALYDAVQDCGDVQLGAQRRVPERCAGQRSTSTR